MNNADACFQLDKLAGCCDDSRGSDKGSFQGSLGTLLDECSVRHDVSRRSFQKDGGSRSLELDWSAIFSNHSRGSNESALGTVGKLEVIGELDVGSILSNDSRWSYQDDVVGLFVSELDVVSIGSDDARVPNDSGMV